MKQNFHFHNLFRILQYQNDAMTSQAEDVSMWPTLQHMFCHWAQAVYVGSARYPTLEGCWAFVSMKIVWHVTQIWHLAWSSSAAAGSSVSIHFLKFAYQTSYPGSSPQLEHQYTPQISQSAQTFVSMSLPPPVQLLMALSWRIKQNFAKKTAFLHNCFYLSSFSMHQWHPGRSSLIFFSIVFHESHSLNLTRKSIFALGWNNKWGEENVETDMPSDRFWIWSHLTYHHQEVTSIVYCLNCKPTSDINIVFGTKAYVFTDSPGSKSNKLWKIWEH